MEEYKKYNKRDWASDRTINDDDWESTEGFEFVEYNYDENSTERCDRCNHKVNHQFIIKHEKHGYKTVGSECLENLEAQSLIAAEKIGGLVKSLRRFLIKDNWTTGRTGKQELYYEARYVGSRLRIYPYSNTANFGWKKNGNSKCKKWDKQRLESKYLTGDLATDKELLFLILKGRLAETDIEKTVIRQLYTKAKNKYFKNKVIKHTL